MKKKEDFFKLRIKEPFPNYKYYFSIWGFLIYMGESPFTRRAGKGQETQGQHPGDPASPGPGSTSGGKQGDLPLSREVEA